MLLIESIPLSFPSSPWSLRPERASAQSRDPRRQPALKSLIAGPRDKLKGWRGTPVLVRGHEMLVDHVAVGPEPVAVLDEFTALDCPNLYPTAALMIGLSNLHRRDHAAQREALDRLHALLHVLAYRLGTALGLDCVSCCLRVDRRDHDAAIVVHADLLRGRHRLALGQVHRVDVLDHLEVPAHAGELEGVVALGYAVAAGGLDVGF